MSAKWKGWEYRILGENQPVEKTARLLKRSENEVKQRIDWVREGTLCDWYGRHRCDGSPRFHRPLLALARRICRSNFAGLRLEPGDIVNRVVRVLRYCFRTFRKSAGNCRLPVQKRFIGWFRYWFRGFLRKELQRRRQKEKKHPRLRFHPDLSDVPAPEADTGGPGEDYRTWSQFLLQEALATMPSRARTFIERRFGNGEGVNVIATDLGLSPKTLSNLYALPMTAGMVKAAVAKVIRALPARHLAPLLAHLIEEVGLTVTQAARLLCVQEAVFDEPLWLIRHGVIPVLKREEAMKLVREGAAQFQLAS